MSRWGNYQCLNRHAPASSGAGASSSHVPDGRLHHLERLRPGLFDGQVVLDIGCNAGAISVQICLNFHAARVTGVDIDDHLIKQARSHLSFRCSRLRSAPGHTAPDLEYFPISAVCSYGHRPTPPARNVRFVAEDWAASNNPLTAGPFDVIVAFSVTKWIHLEHLDDGIRSFFKKCADCLSEGGHLVVEAQPWASYEKAIRAPKSPHFAPNLRQLQVRPEDFEGILKSHGLDHILTSHQLPRPISVYRKGGPKATPPP